MWLVLLLPVQAHKMKTGVENLNPQRKSLCSWEHITFETLIANLIHQTNEAATMTDQLRFSHLIQSRQYA